MTDFHTDIWKKFSLATILNLDNDLQNIEQQTEASA